MTRRRTTFARFAAVLALAALVGCGRSPNDIDVVVETKAIDRPTVERALDEIRNTCRPLFSSHAADVRSVRAVVSDETSTQIRRHGWGIWIEIVVSLRSSPTTLTPPTETTARYLAGGGSRPGLLAFSRTGAALCDQTPAEGRSQVFLPSPGLAEYLPRLLQNPTADQLRLWHEEEARAMSGDYQSQRNVAWCHLDGCNGVTDIDDVKACTWRFVIAAAKHPKSDASDVENLETDCRSALAPQDLDYARRTAGELFRKIYGRPMQ